MASFCFIFILLLLWNCSALDLVEKAISDGIVSSSTDSEETLFMLMNDVEIVQALERKSVVNEKWSRYQDLKKSIGDMKPMETVSLLEEFVKNEKDSEVQGFIWYEIAQFYKFRKHGMKDYGKYTEKVIKSAVCGNPEGQFEVGFLLEHRLINLEMIRKYIAAEAFATSGLDDQEKVSKESYDGLSLLHYFFAALGGSYRAQMTMGYKHLHGYGVPKKCSTAAIFYKMAAQQGLEYASGHRNDMTQKFRITDNSALEQQKQLEDFMKFYKYTNQEGSTQLLLGFGYMFGVRGLPQDASLAQKYFREAIQNEEYAGYGYLGEMYAKGIGVPQDFAKAYEYYSEGTKLGDPSSQNGLGALHYLGMGVDQDSEIAFHYFNMSSSQGFSKAQYNLGYLYLTGNGVFQHPNTAYKLFTLAASKDEVRAQYQLGVMNLEGLATAKSCPTATQFFKTVAEKGFIHGTNSEAFQLFYDDVYDDSLTLFAEVATTGEESAQSNSAYLYDKGLGVDDQYTQSFFHEKGISKTYFSKNRALHWYKRSGVQGNTIAYLKVGDFYYYGIGTSVDMDKSVSNYRRASDRRNPQAAYNLGYMHENGLGLPKDFFLAKRFYDLAVTLDGSAYVPVKLTLIKLYMKWGLDYVVNRKGRLVFESDEVPAANLQIRLLQIVYDHLSIFVLVGMLIALLLIQPFIVRMGHRQEQRGQEQQEERINQ